MAIANRPLIAHVIHRLGIGGLENGLVNLLNHMPSDRYRHAIVCMTDFDAAFRARIRSQDLAVFALHKREGNDLGAQLRAYRLFREIRPNIVHTRNLSALDALLPAAFAAVPRRVHGEHGRDADDPDGTNFKRIWVRRLHRPLVHRFTTVSLDLKDYLVRRVGVRESRVTQIYNGVDTVKFRPAARGERSAPGPFAGQQVTVIGTVGRLDAVKDQLGLIDAFASLVRADAGLTGRLRLVIAGDGPMRAALQQRIEQHDLAAVCWLAGARNDVAELLRGLDVFVLPSLGEGVSNTILEAMASGLPVVATQVGGNVEIVAPERTGILVPRAAPDALATAIRRYVDDPKLREAHGAAGRAQTLSTFSLDAMVAGYLAVYDAL